MMTYRQYSDTVNRLIDFNILLSLTTFLDTLTVLKLVLKRPGMVLGRSTINAEQGTLWEGRNKLGTYARLKDNYEIEPYLNSNLPAK